MLSNHFVKFWIDNDILYNEFITPIELTRENVIEIIKLRHELCNGVSYYWCTSFHNIKSMPKDGRDYTDKYGQDFLHASAAVVSNIFEAFVVNIFIKLKRPKLPFKAFSCKEEAVAWLLELKAKNGH